MDARGRYASKATHSSYLSILGIPIAHSCLLSGGGSRATHRSKCGLHRICVAVVLSSRREAGQTHSIEVQSLPYSGAVYERFVQTEYEPFLTFAESMSLHSQTPKQPRGMTSDLGSIANSHWRINCKTILTLNPGQVLRWTFAPTASRLLHHILID